MERQFSHAMLPRATHDELARQDFVNSLQAYMGRYVSPKLQEVYTNQVEPQFVQTHQRPPQNRYEVRDAMQAQLFYNWWGALRRTIQEIMWESVDSSIQRQLPDLTAQYTQIAQSDRSNSANSPVGTLALDPEFVVPSYQTAVDIHCMPGGYHAENGTDDITSGALYDRGVYLYVRGRLGPLNDGLGQALIHNYLKPNYPEWQPARILDLGCSVGHSTLPYVDAYPDAEVHAIDIGASLLRYAHARAEALGKKVHFSQQNAEQTHFPDGSFDLIVSHIFPHEIPPFAIRNVFQECYRLLAPGGIMAHLEAPLYSSMNPFQAFLYDWETANNNEPFWSAMRDLDLVTIMAEAGFATDQIVQTFIPATVQSAGKPKDGFGGRGNWLVLAASKSGKHK